MPNNAPVIRQPDGSFVAVRPDGSRVAIPPHLMSQIELPLGRVLQEQGVSFGQRWTVQNVANSPEAAKAYLKADGFEVRDLPPQAGEFNFAVRKDPSDPWRVVDPRGLDLEDFTDWTMETLTGLATGVGAVVGSALGPVGTFFGGGAGSAIGEAGRQFIGKKAGVPQDVSGTDVAVSGLVGAASVPIGAVAGRALRATGRGLLKATRGGGTVLNELATRMASVRAAGGRSAEEINILRAMRPEKATAQLRGADANAKHFIAVISKLDRGVESPVSGRRYTIPEKLKEVQMLRAAGQGENPLTVDLSSAFDPVFQQLRILKGLPRTAEATRTQIADILAPMAKGARKKGIPLASRKLAAERHQLPQEMLNFIDRIQTLILRKVPITTVPVDLADLVRSTARRHAKELGAIDAVTGRSTRTLSGDVVKDVGARVRNAIMEAMGGPTSEFGRNHASLVKSTRALNAIKGQMSWGKDIADVHRRTVGLLRALDADTHMGFMKYVSQLETQFKLPSGTLTDIVEEQAISEGFGFRGAAQFIGPITAGGRLRGPAMFGLAGGAAGAFMGGLPWALAGGAIGAAAGSPVTLYGATKVGLRVGQALTGAEARLSALVVTPEARAAGIAAIRSAAQPVADAAVAREQAPKRNRRTVHVGQF